MKLFREYQYRINVQGYELAEVGMYIYAGVKWLVIMVEIRVKKQNSGSVNDESNCTCVKVCVCACVPLYEAIFVAPVSERAVPI
jgi:hypothetical protein